MKEIQTQQWECSCGHIYESKHDCEKCESKHEEAKAITTVGSKVRIDKGSYGGEQGRRDLTWWPNVVWGVVVEQKQEADSRLWMGLVEYEGERSWHYGFSLVALDKPPEPASPVFASGPGGSWMST